MTLLKNQFKVFLLHLIILCCVFEQSIDYHSFHRLNRRKTKRNNCAFLFFVNTQETFFQTIRRIFLFHCCIQKLQSLFFYLKNALICLPIPFRLNNAFVSFCQYLLKLLMKDPYSLISLSILHPPLLNVALLFLSISRQRSKGINQWLHVLKPVSF